MTERSYLSHRVTNILHSFILIAGMVGLLGFLGHLLAGVEGMLWAFALGGFFFVLTPRVTPGILIRLYGARPMNRDEYPLLFDLLAEISQRAGLKKVPHPFHITSSMLNAFTVGTPDNSFIVLTDGLVRALEPKELAGVLAHELSHVKFNDLRVMGLADVISRVVSGFSLMGQIMLLVSLPIMIIKGVVSPVLVALVLLFVAPILSLLLQLALSRTREINADMSAAQLTGDPLSLASALKKLEKQRNPFMMRIFLPGKGERQPSLLRTHPVTDERVRRLEELAQTPSSVPPLSSLSSAAPPPYKRRVSPHGPPRWRPGGFWF